MGGPAPQSCGMGGPAPQSCGMGGPAPPPPAGLGKAPAAACGRRRRPAGGAPPRRQRRRRKGGRTRGPRRPTLGHFFGAWPAPRLPGDPGAWCRGHRPVGVHIRCDSSEGGWGWGSGGRRAHTTNEKK
eukprot:gene19856-biopygen8512